MNSWCLPLLLAVHTGFLLQLQGGGNNALFDPCLQYTLLNDSWRNKDFNSSTLAVYKCDDALSNKWLRFVGIAGDIMVQKNVSEYHSGTQCSIYLNFIHPDTVYETLTGSAYCQWKGNAQYVHFMNVMETACFGGFYVYMIPEILCTDRLYTGISLMHSSCQGNPCGPNATCLTSGGCVCDSGFNRQDNTDPTPESYGCIDIDECTKEPGICGSNTVCTNTIGNYTCSCETGFFPSTGTVWDLGTICIDLQQKINSLAVQESQNLMTTLSNIMEDLENSPDLVIPETVAIDILTTLVNFAGRLVNMTVQQDTAEIGSLLLKIYEKFLLFCVENTQNNYTANVVTPEFEISIMAVGPGSRWRLGAAPVLSARHNTMEIDISSIAKKNNGSAAAVLMSVSGMDTLLSGSSATNDTKVYSDVTIALVPRVNGSRLPESVNFTFQHKQEPPKDGRLTCVYWEDRGGVQRWSTEGCVTLGSVSSHTACSCSHLSTFAIIMQTGQDQGGVDEEDPILTWLSPICMGVGMIFLSLAVLSFLFCSWNPKVNNTARLHLSLNLLLAHLLFSLGINRTQNQLVCAIIAGLLHYAFVSSFVWMFLEALQLFLLVRGLNKVQVIQREGLKTQYLLLIGYGTPLIVVGVSAGLFPSGYGSATMCWLSMEHGFLWSFLGPMCMIIGINCLLFGIMLWNLRLTLTNMKSDVSQAKDTRLIIFKILAQCIILGVAWLLGFWQNSLLAQYLFIILSSQQGTFIFIVHCLFNREVREEYVRWFSLLCRVESTHSRRPSVCEDTLDERSEPSADE
ncbi:adhesion G protein-coupled receptor E2-like [Brienomyrus brachyistius]|uniref:adhesion G protein-coupled receptor E2-like n=1 Tax=Brienomyrus brachyistius TaxID=42636 RepID=UPI0020B29E3C|nr:adhesion G protein-coupled receptor E2-like [Brienomyrus brachyistius]